MDSMTAWHDDIAIIGMSCRVSGAKNPSELWNNLVSSKECQQEIDRFNIGGFYHKSGGPRQGLTNVRHAYFLDEGVDKFDHDFFSISPREASALDPQQRLLLEIAYEALENAGIPIEEVTGTDTAVYVGLSTSDYAVNNLRDIDSLPEYHSTGASNAMAANRISYFFDWHGPSMVIDTACSSTATTLHQAILALKAKDTAMALVCGSNLIISPDTFVHMSTLGFLSPSGKCNSFDSSADGYARGEGVTAIMLKPLKEALIAGDPVRAVIKGSRINQDGRTSGITLPSSEAQRRNIEQLYTIKKLDPGSVQYVEAHGTGTSAGDPRELSALNEVFKKSHMIEKLIVGSVKSNIGHLEASAALISIIKTVECLERGQIPPQMHFREPNPNIDFSALDIPTKTLKWPENKSGVRRAAVNSFGFGGTNGHVVLDHFPKRALKPSITDRPFLFNVSATSQSSLYLLAEKYADYTLTHLPNLMDLAHTLLAHRSSFRKTVYLTASSHTGLAEKFRQLREQQTTSLAMSPNSGSELAFVFTGQGAQWVGMGKGLLNHSQVFTATIERCDGALAELLAGPTWTIRSQLSQPPETSLLHVPCVSQVVCTALQIGLVEVWKMWGLKPSIVLGHSSGEIAAAYSAGMLSLRDAIAIAFYRGACMDEDKQMPIQSSKGAMCVVSMNELECEATLSSYEGRVALAAVNSPTSCTLSGDRDAIDEILVSCKADGVFCRALRLDVAYHSHHMLLFAPSYIQALVNTGISPLNVEESPCEMFSSVTQQKINAQELLPDYWAQNMVSTVQFAAALKEASRCHKDLAFLEIGPHPALKSAVIDTMTANGLPDVTYFRSCYRYQPDFESMLESAGEIIAAGLPIDRKSINSADRMIESDLVHETGRVLTDLPSYQWDHKMSHWAETRASWNLRHRRFPRHPLLGARAYGDSPLDLSWRNKLILSEVTWVEELIASESVPSLPTVLLVMLLEAARQTKDYPHLRSCTVELVGLTFVATNLDMASGSEHGQIETILNLRPNDDNSAFQVEILITLDGSECSWKKCCTADLRFIAQKPHPVKKLGDLVAHDETLIEQIKTLRPSLVQGIHSLQLERHSAKGYMNQRNVDDDYLLDGNTAALLFKISQTLMLASGPPAKFRTSRIDLLEITQTSFQLDSTEFYASTTRLSPIKGHSSIHILDANGIRIDCQNLETQVQNISQARPRLESLFFKPQVLLDVSQMQTSDPLNIYEVLELVTHKWPMSDIGAIKTSDNDVDIIRSCLNADNIGARLYFRSISLLQPESDRTLRRTRTVQSFKQNQFHLLLGEAHHVISHISSLTQYGLVCTKLKTESDRDLLGRHLDFICDVLGLISEGWILGRPKLWKDLALPARPLRILSTKKYNFRDFYEYRPFDLTVMEPGMPLTALQVEACKSNDIIVMDVGVRSILTSWTGKCLLPWMNALMKHAKNLLWVTQQASDDPFNSVAGAFIKTMRSEQPTIQASSLVVQDTGDLSCVNGLIFDIFDRIAAGQVEGEYVVRDSKVHILRYHPDDDLAASVGAVPYHWSTTAPSDKFYTVSIAAVKQALVFSSGHRPSAKTRHGSVWIRVNASVIDHWDNARFVGHGNPGDQEQGIGQFFSGTLLSGANCALKPGSTVIGWLPGAHKSHLLVPVGQLCLLPKVTSEIDALAFCAVYSTALAIVHGLEKHSIDKVLDIQVSGALREALFKVCQARGILIRDHRTYGPSYIVAFDHQSGFKIDGNPISLADCTMSHLLAESLSMMTEERFRLHEAPQCFNLSGTQTAFEVAQSHLLSTVLVHSRKDQALEHVITACPEHVLFRDDGWYILAGGLGGLGRYLIEWMAFKGARHFMILSRSGHVTKIAESTTQAVEHLGAQIKVVKCDTCDSRAVTDVLADARKSRPIRGCLNLVLQLANSPLATMTSEQWDAALQSKIKSSWNLHQATLSDGLDMFIMFSSISSISGNRTQANYATGNAFQNSLARYRKSVGLPGIAIALGAMSGIGILAEDKDLLQTLRKSGMLPLKPNKLLKIFEAAVLESRSISRTLLVTGFEMFKKLDGTVQSSPEQNQIFWADWPEFGGLFDHKPSNAAQVKSRTLLQRLEALEPESAHDALCREFVICLGSLLGTETSDFDLTVPLASYGLDSLNAVSCRYWFFKQLEIDVAIFDILGSRSVNDLVTRVLAKLSIKPQVTQDITVPKPVRHDDRSLQIRPVSHSQSRLWFLHNFLSNKTVYNLLLVCHLSGKPDVVRFVKAWSILMRRHEILHSRICETADGWQQVPTGKVVFPLEVVKATLGDFHEQDRKIKHAARDYEFNPGSGDLIRGWLLLSDSRYRFYLASHHMAWDRASVNAIFKETSAIYKALMCGEAPETHLDPVPYQFVDYAIWQNECMTQDSLIQLHLDYWKHQLAGAPEAVSLLPVAIADTRPFTKKHSVDTVMLHFDSTKTLSLKGLCKANAVTPFMLMVSALSVLIHRLTTDTDIVIGIADGDRGHPEFDNLVGFTVNMLAIRCKVDPKSSYAIVLEQHRKACFEAYEHRSVPFEYLLQKLDVPRRPSHSPIFQITVNYQMERAFPECDYGNFKFTEYEHFNANSQSDFSLDIEETNTGEFNCTFTYDTSLYSAAAIHDLAERFRTLTDSILETNAGSSIETLNLTTKKDQELMAASLRPIFDQQFSLDELDRDLFPILFERAVAKYPQKTAIMDAQREITYAELDAITTRIARYLVQCENRKGGRIGVYCLPGLDMILAIYGILKAGFAYVPLDPDLSENRVHTIVEDAEISVILTAGVNKRELIRLFAAGVTTTSVSYILKSLAQANELGFQPWTRQTRESESFCCIYTSGSTGHPKGIEIGHKQLRYQMEGYHRFIGTGQSDRVLLASSITFDMSLTSIFGAILHYATIVVAPREARLSSIEMIDFVVKHDVSSCTFTTTQLKMLLSSPNRDRLSQWTSLRSIVIGGEKVPPRVIRDFYSLRLDNVSIFNGYGPAESTVCNSLRKLHPGDSESLRVPLAPPLFPAKFYILDEHCNPAPIGVPGELYIGGPTINKGYLNRADLTEAAFLKAPSLLSRTHEQGALYRTGDSFRITHVGTLEVLGRVNGDRQVKIRGIRIELEEIENVIYQVLRDPKNSEAGRVSLVTVIYHDIDGIDGILAAYLTTEDGITHRDGRHSLLKACLRSGISTLLPVHMRPSVFIVLPDLPKTESGKIDYQTMLLWPLPKPEAINGDTTGLETSLNKLQSEIAGVWKVVLGLDGNLSKDDDFFAIGGHSLVLMQVQRAIKEHFGVSMSLGDMFSNPTIEGFERLIASHRSPRCGLECNGLQVDDVNHSNAAHMDDRDDFDRVDAFIDWDVETSLPDLVKPLDSMHRVESIANIAITGACTMAGSHFLELVLSTTSTVIHCIGTEGDDAKLARANVLRSLDHWQLLQRIPVQALDRLITYPGTLSHPTLGLTATQIAHLDKEVGAIFQLDSEVSLLKRYESLRAGNVDSIKFLISLAHSKVNNTKAIYHLSTWAVPHLQTWTETKLSSNERLTHEVEMTNIKPGSDGTLGYLKARWACEALLYRAARCGIPVTIFRASMCGGSSVVGVPLDRTDINRRILEATLRTGLVPDFGSAAGGGMSWISADFLVRSIFFLSQQQQQRSQLPGDGAEIYHIVADEHIPYTSLPDVLQTGYDGNRLRSASPEQWFEALRAASNEEMAMQAEVLEKWVEAGWVPFPLHAEKTKALLKKASIEPPKVDRKFLMRLVIGDQGF